VDQRSDIYAVGCILYELLCGSVPFSGSSFLEVLNHHVLTPVTPPTQVNPHVRVSTELEIVVLKSLAKQPEDRFQTMKELSEALLTTPEGMALGRSISSMIGLGDAPRAATARAESRALRTEVHGSPVSRPDASPAASPNGPATNGPTSARTAAPATHTLVDVELPRGSLLPLWIGLASVGLLASAAAFWFLGRESGDETPPLVVEPVAAAEPAEPAEPVGSAPPQQPTPAGTADAGTEQPAPTDPGAQPASGQPSAPPPAAPAKIVVHVSTVPAGAVVTQDGFQVCDTTPCDVSLDPGAAVVLSAKLGSKTGSAKVLAQREQSVTIALGAPAARPKPSGGSSLCEVEVDGLKILRPCQ
ncbi:MAG TPA: hypothetical protein VLC09_00920, partial [Polyangiaceae bacterium]|nr:hypothetical protein [Polyangiaceae bacterium]